MNKNIPVVDLTFCPRVSNYTALPFSNNKVFYTSKTNNRTLLITPLSKDVASFKFIMPKPNEFSELTKQYSGTLRITELNTYCFVGLRYSNERSTINYEEAVKVLHAIEGLLSKISSIHGIEFTPQTYSYNEAAPLPDYHQLISYSNTNKMRMRVGFKNKHGLTATQFFC